MQLLPITPASLAPRPAVPARRSTPRGLRAAFDAWRASRRQPGVWILVVSGVKDDPLASHAVDRGPGVGAGERVQATDLPRGTRPARRRRRCAALPGDRPALRHHPLPGN